MVRDQLTYIGSSPRLRGTVWAIGLPLSLGRFIPAPAGNGVAPCV